MKRIVTLNSLLVLTALFSPGGRSYAQCGSTGCNSNAFLTSGTNASTIAYDNIVSTFHSSIARKEDGTVWGWGEIMGADGGTAVLSPTQITPANGYNYTGDILLFSGGSRSQNVATFSLLTTTGLYAWGNNAAGGVYEAGVRNNSTAFALINPTNDDDGDGLPPGVDPADVKMMFSTSGTTVITTCSGQVWIITQGLGYSLGTNVSTLGTTTAQKQMWHQVQQSAVSSGDPLSNVVAVRGNENAFVALKSDGSVWTWGYQTLLGNGTALANRPYAQQMPGLPATPKMIGMTKHSSSNALSYYLLGTNGNVYAMGDNSVRQLGDFTTTNSTSWVQVKKSSAANDFLTNITWISPQEHDNQFGAINVLTADGKLWAWGYNGLNMLTSGSVNVGINPTNPTGSLATTDVIGAVETGGHTTVIIKQCAKNFGYIGHKINGSKGDGTSVTGNDGTFSFQTAEMPLCSSGQPHIDTPDSSFVCNGSTLTPASPVNPNNVFSIYTGNATITSAGVLTLTGPGPIRVLYGAPGCEAPDTVTLQTRDFGNLDPAKWPVAWASTLSANSAWLGIDFPTSDCQTTTTDPADGLIITGGGVTGAGTQASPWALNFARTYTFNLTVNGNGTPKPVYWAVWYDVNGDGDFTDADDIFNTGNTNHGSPVAVPPFSVAVPVTAGPAGAIRVAATATTITFTKAMNGQVALVNGEIEDFFTAQSAAPQTISGTVFNDGNGMTGGANGTPMAGVTVTLYAADGVTVIATTTTDANGNYSFTGLDAGDYVMGITPPGGYSHVSSTDGTPTDGRTSVSLPVGGTGATGINFGLNRPPVADPINQPVPRPVNNTMPAGTVTQNVSGTDPEQGTFGNSNTIVITQLPNNATMLYNGVPVTPGQQITGFNPALLSYTNITNGSVSVTFNYAFIDAAGTQGSSAPFTVNWADSSPLPVRLLELNAQLSGSNVLVKWSTAAEVNLDRFEIEYSVNGSSYSQAGTVAAAGNSSSSNLQYAYTHQQAALLSNAPVLYYRLKMMDRDGAFSYSPVVAVNIRKGNSDAKVLPSITKKGGMVTVIARGIKEIALYNMNGQQVWIGRYNNQSAVVIATDRLPAGVYAVKINQTQISKFIIAE